MARHPPSPTQSPQPPGQSRGIHLGLRPDRPPRSGRGVAATAHYRGTRHRPATVSVIAVVPPSA